MILENSFIRNKTVGVAVSGGKDSMCLLDLLLKAKYRLNILVVVVNVEHGIRQDTSVRDSLFVKDYCDKLGVPCYSYSVDSVAYSKAHGFSLEQSARILRYECFFDAIEKGKCDVIATAHHQSDNVETVLFNLFRGTSVSGASGINPVDYDGKIIRPLIKTSKTDIDEYVKNNSIPFVTDETNYDDNYTRNYIRLNVIPEIKKIFPSFENAVERFSESAKLDDEYLFSVAEQGIRNYADKIELDIDTHPSIFYRRTLIALKTMGITKDFEKSHLQAVYSLINKEVSSSVNLPKGVVAVKDYGVITLYRPCEIEKIEYPFGVGEYKVYGGTLVVKRVEMPENLKSGFYCDGDKIPENAVIRYRKDGDRFTKFGGGTKKLNDFLTDRKVLERDRNKIPVVAFENCVYFVNEIAVSDLIKVDKDTKIVLQFIYY